MNTPLVQQAQTSGREIVDDTFWRSIVVIGIALVAALIYHSLAPRLTPATRSAANSP